MSYQKRFQYIVAFFVLATLFSVFRLKQLEGSAYYGEGEGYDSDIQVQVYVYKGEITKIDYVHGDSPDVGGLALQEMVEKVLEEQAFDVLPVAGATATSEGFLEALEEAASKIANTQEGE